MVERFKSELESLEDFESEANILLDQDVTSDVSDAELLGADGQDSPSLTNSKLSEEKDVVDHIRESVEALDDNLIDREAPDTLVDPPDLRH